MAKTGKRKLAYVKEAESDFLDMVAHQLRGPLGGIRASASMLAGGDFGKLPAKAREAIMLIEDSATRLLSLSDSFLNASRLEVGKYESLREPTNIHREIKTIVAEMKSAASSKHLALEIKIIDVPTNAAIDVEALRLVVFNLLDNAIKYTDAGTVELEATATAKKLTIQVADTGVGLSQGEMKQLFKKFHRGKNGHDKSVDGTGLGLFIVKRVVEAAGGDVTVVSDGPGKGSTFRAWLPFSAVSHV